MFLSSAGAIMAMSPGPLRPGLPWPTRGALARAWARPPASQTTIRPAQVANSPGIPTCLVSQPPTAPPAKKPSDWRVLYTPRAAPRACAGASRDARLGWVASSTLKPQKNRNSRTPSASTLGMRCDGEQPQLHQADQADRRQEHGPQVAAPLEREQREPHHDERGQHRRQVDHPVVLLGQAGLHQQRRHGHPHGQLHGVQHEHAHVQPHQARVAQHLGQPPARHGLVHRRLRRRPPDHDRHARQRQQRR